MAAGDGGRPADALRRRLRDDPAAVAHLDGLRRAAYGRDGGDGPLMDVPEELRAAGDGEPRLLPAPVVRLLVEEARLIDEGRALLALEPTDVRDPSATAAPDEVDAAEPTYEPSPSAAAPGPAHGALRTGAPLAPGHRRVLRPIPLAAAAATVLALGALGALSSSGAFMQDDSWRLRTPTSTPRAEPTSAPERPRVPVPAFTALPPADEPMTAEETTAALRTTADFDWEMAQASVPGAVRPDVAVERVMPRAEWADQQVACLAESGMEAYADADGGLQYVAGDPLVIYACSVRFPLQPTPPPSDALLAYVHDYYVSYLIPCYAAEGEPYEGVVPDAPAFVAGFRAGDHWNPMPAAMSAALQSRCPEAPAALR
jgi:hypothetical protein